MKRSQFDAGTFGIGELITQKKLFRVPRHQRSYAWTRESVIAFISDIEAAFVGNEADYFIGLVVIQGPEEGEWILLDGQQRLTTSAMLFAAIRNWLASNGLRDDAKQIETEFLGVRRLGGEYSSRMQLNEENQSTFRRAVVDEQSAALLRQELANTPRRSSNHLLIDAALECQLWINVLADQTGKTPRDKAERLFRLSSFLESRVKTVCVEVSSDVDAYILFESLNDRGVELSALDLVKNYAYSKSSAATAYQFDRLWMQLIEQLEDRNPDDLLKVSWTAKHGVVQKTQLFRKIRDKYRTTAEVLAYIEQISKDAAHLSALDDPEHVMWSQFPGGAREHVYVLGLLGSRQIRPVVLSAVSNLDPELIADVLWFLIVVVVRYQIVGRGRTGVMEKVFGTLCAGIADKSINTRVAVESVLMELWVDDEHFTSAFAEHAEPRWGRYAYFLAAMELEYRRMTGQCGDATSGVQSLLAESNMVLLFHAETGREEDHVPRIGGFALAEKTQSPLFGTEYSMESAGKSCFQLTKAAMLFGESGGVDVKRRSIFLGELACRLWRFRP